MNTDGLRALFSESNYHSKLERMQLVWMISLSSEIKLLEPESSGHVGFWVELTSSSSQHRGREFESSHGICSAPSVYAFQRFPNSSILKTPENLPEHFYDTMPSSKILPIFGPANDYIYHQAIETSSLIRSMRECLDRERAWLSCSCSVLIQATLWMLWVSCSSVIRRHSIACLLNLKA